MLLLRKEQCSNVCDYAPIARAFYRMDHAVEGKVKIKFDVAYMMAKEGISFLKMKSLCQLQERHGVDLGECYKNDHLCYFCGLHSSLQGELGAALQKSKFFSIQMDGSTDSGNIEELYMVVYLTPLLLMEVCIFAIGIVVYSSL